MENAAEVRTNITSTNSKIITMAFMMSGVLIGLFVSVLIDTMAAVTTGGLGRFLGQDLVHHGVPVVFGIGSFLILQFSKPIVTWADEVTTEIRRVVWPSRKDTVAMTIMVCIMVLVCGIALGLFDLISGTIIDWLLHQNFFGLFS